MCGTILNSFLLHMNWVIFFVDGNIMFKMADEHTNFKTRVREIKFWNLGLYFFNVSCVPVRFK